jgi:hypothetical protein
MGEDCGVGRESWLRGMLYKASARSAARFSMISCNTKQLQLLKSCFFSEDSALNSNSTIF